VHRAEQHHTLYTETFYCCGISTERTVRKTGYWRSKIGKTYNRLRLLAAAKRFPW